LIGVAQRTVRPEEGEAPEPLDLWEQMARAAAEDSGGRGVIEAIESVGVVHTISWHYDDPPARLADRLGLAPGARHYSGLSGTSTQKFISSAAEAILAGQIDVALVTGAECLATKKRIKKAGRKVEWSHATGERPPPPWDDPLHPAEVAHQVFQAYVTFAMFDVARRAHLGLTPEQNLQQLGELFAPMTRVAAANPHAWFRKEHSAEELTRIEPSNRMVATPYPKNLVAIMEVDMASAAILTSHEKADALGVPKDRRVYLRGWSHAQDPLYVAEREALWRSIAMEESSRAALAGAGIGLDDVAHLDLYSCFPSSVNFALDALCARPDPARPLTVTGGLPFHGGPGSNYVGHSVACLVERLRADPSAYGMVSGVGMHMTNHIFAVYSASPGELRPTDHAAVQARVDAAPRKAIVNVATGDARLAAYTVVHDRQGPTFGVAVCDLSPGERCYATVADAGLLAAMGEGEWVGREVVLEDAGKGVNRIRP
jgi:acetyl-CoA C-acetyltransferase